MRVVYWPDIHTRISLIQKFLHKEYGNYDKFVLTGDFFDKHYDTPETNRQTAEFLKRDLLYDDKIIVLAGNHDNYYRFAEKCEHCVGSGFSWDKFDAINSILKNYDWERFANYSYIDGWLASHAGFAPDLFWQKIKTPEGNIDLNLLNQIIKKGYDTVNQGLSHFCFEAGESRKGTQKIGGLFWQCWEELIPLPGIRQILGHTRHKSPQIKYYNNNGILVKRNFRNEKEYPSGSIAVDLDAENRHYGVVSDGKLTIHRTVFYT